MGQRIAYSIKEAAEATGVKKLHIVDAIRERALIARAVAGEPLILASDLEAWAETWPEFYSNRD